MTHLILLGVRRPRQPGGEDRVLRRDGRGLRDRLGGAVQVLLSVYHRALMVRHDDDSVDMELVIKAHWVS